MAINPGVQWPGKTTAADANYPYASSKDETAPGANDGTPYEKVRADDIFGMQQFILQAAGITPSGNPDTALDKNASQYAQALLHLVTATATFDDVGIADAYDLEAIGDNPAPAAYNDAMTIFFTPDNTNTGASTVDVEGLGIKNIFFNGVAVVAGAIFVGKRQTIIFDLANDRFNLEMLGDNLANISGIDLTLSGDAPSPPDANTLYKDNILKGWISFDGTGVIAIFDSFNVSSIVDNGIGDYTVNWDRDFANTNYSIVATIESHTGSNSTCINFPVGGIYSVGATQVVVSRSAVDAGAEDSARVNFHAHGDQA